MNGERKSLTLNGINLSHALLILLAVLVIGVCSYLTKHFFNVHFADDLVSGAICDVSQFWSCDKATLSPISHIKGIPLSVLGLLFGVFLIGGSIFPSENVEKTNFLIATVNIVLCLFLFIYSLVVLKGLCLLCTFYYLLSLGIFLLFFKKGIRDMKPSMKVIGIYGVLTLIVGGLVSYNVNAKLDRKEEVAQILIKQFSELPQVGDPQGEYSGKIIMSTSEFKDAPIRLSIFSDFQCPACKMMSELVPKIIERYKGKVNIQYFYFPLDQACNHNLTHPLHQNACQAAYLAACLPQKFSEVHDDIFKAQDEISESWIQKYAEKNKVENCIKQESTKNFVLESIKVGDKFQVNSTPALVLNGVKISMPPINNLYVILDELSNRGGQIGQAGQAK